MKKTSLVSLASLSLMTSVGLVGCASKTYEYALVTDVGDIDDQSFNQTSWEATKAFAESKEKTVNYYRPAKDSKEARIDSIDQAVKKGAKVIVCPGFLFEDAVYETQVTYPNVKFVLIDGNPHTTDYKTYKTEKNTVGIVFQEEISGFLAGYGAVKDGLKSLGFCGGQAVPAVQRFGSGFIQGADKAAQEDSVNVSIKYYYAGAFAQTDEATAKMKSWYTSGVESVFASGGKVYKSVMEGCKEKKDTASWIGVDTDQSKAPDVKDSGLKILTSAVKGLKEAVTSALEAYNNDKWSEIGGNGYNLGLSTIFGPVAAKDYVGLPTDESSWKFARFTKEQYNTVVGKIKDKSITIDNSTTTAPTTSSNCTVTWESDFAPKDEGKKE